MIDLHCHILPEIDDGAKNWVESMEMAQSLTNQGVTRLVASPHYLAGYFTPKLGEILAKTEELQLRLDREGIDLQVYPGSEVHIAPDLPELIKEGRVLTINNGGKYVLVEMPFQELPRYTEEVFFRLRLMGITPVIAHPERNSDFGAQPEKILSLIEKGSLVQVNTGSLVGIYGRKAEKTAKYLMKQRAVHFLGSDMHGTGEGETPVAQAARVLEQSMGPAEFQQIGQSGPQLLLAGETVTGSGKREKTVDEQRGWLGRLKRIITP